MGSVWSWLRNQDPDDLFAYSSAKVVRIRDRRLGLLRLAFQIAIAVYVIGFVLIKNKQYLEYDEPTGTIQTSLIKPDGAVDPAQYPICKQYTGSAPSDPVIDTAKCTVWDENQVREPISVDNSMFITTRASVSTESRICSDGVVCDHPFVTTSAGVTKYFTIGVENFTIGVLHSFEARRFLEDSSQKTSAGTLIPGTGNQLYAGTSKDLTGTLVSKDGTVLEIFNGSMNGINIIPLQMLLDAAGVNLNGASDSVANGASPESVRSAGIILNVQIKYSILNNEKVFVISANHIPGSQFKVVTVENMNSTHRINYNRHGVQLNFIQTGSISRFVFQSFLIQLFTALGMLAMANVLVDTIMLYVLPERILYASAKYDFTEDFSDIRDKKIPGKILAKSKSDAGNHVNEMQNVPLAQP